ncbi:Ig-like domain-containing protein [Methanobrevibacter sp. UBA212]|uniref:Ig-like domain-containing protein n=1 Tax=Methanobrevibacter sp. UBA212 TaxID=1915476 RepID=UPI0025EE442E|nr:Ig-like domain-containing protein [Methanobrevibacter sp. UBA212]
MKHKYLITLLLIVSIFLSINVISATNVDLNESSDLLNAETDVVLDDISESNIDSEVSMSDESQILESDSNTTEVWVNQNVSSSGDGSKENPFSNLQDAHDKIINNSAKNAIINIADGEYQIPCKIKATSSDPDFAFTDINLTVNGLGDNVILSADDRPSRTFHINTGSNLTINNIIFNISCVKWDVVYGFDRNTNKAVSLTNSIISVNNCTFTFKNKYVGLVRNEYNINYVGCIFVNAKDKLFTSSKGTAGLCNFENCILVNSTFSDSTKFISDDGKITVNGIWLGTNTLPNMDTTCLEKYAIFTVSENYLDGNQYEIVGRLTWNGTNSSEGMENFPPMTVTLTSTTGEIQNATLTNGIFKANYTSSSSEHKITAKLDSEEINLTFTNLDLGLDAPTISFGDKQNITITFPQLINGTVTVNVNGKKYSAEVNDSNSITVPITEELTIGNHEVNVTFIDKTNHIYGFNTTTITISKVKDYTFNISEITDVKVGDIKEITISLPNDAEGQVIISIGNTNKFTETVNGNTTNVNITGFSLGENIINITYSGNDKYEPNTKIIKVAAVKETTLTTTDVTTMYNVAKELVVTLTSNGEVLVNKTVNVVVGTINNNLTTNASGQVSIDVSTLAPNTYVANIAFAGDDLYLKSSTTANVVINKIDSLIKATTVTTTYNVAKNLVVSLTANGKALANQKVTVKVGTISKTLTTNAKGQVSVDVSKLTPKTYTATFTYAGDGINTKSSNTAKVVVNKAKPKITAKKATFKAKTKTKKYSIVLKDNKGKTIKKAKVTLKVKGKTYKATTNAKGKATFKITKLTKKGKNTATIKFGGNNYFKSISKKVNIVVK